VKSTIKDLERSPEAAPSIRQFPVASLFALHLAPGALAYVALADAIAPAGYPPRVASASAGARVGWAMSKGRL
jgi:hypothetical protein